MDEITRRQIVVVIPALNEADTVADVVQGARRYASEIIVVDDGSTDTTAETAMKVGAQVIRIPRNRGKAHALSIGLATAALSSSSVVLCMDADGQHDPEDIPRLIQPILQGEADMVIGSRFIDLHARDMIPKYRKVGQSALTLATNIGNHVKITDSQSGFRSFRRETLNGFGYNAEGMSIESNMVREAVTRGLRIKEIPIVVKYRGLATSTLNPGAHGMTVLGSILKSVRSEHPLLFFGASGFVMTVIGVVLGIYSLQHYISVRTLPFGPTLLSVMLTALGVLFVLVGLILNAISGLIVDRKEIGLNGR